MRTGHLGEGSPGGQTWCGDRPEHAAHKGCVRLRAENFSFTECDL